MIDLHTHSTVSDGTDSPTAVIRLAAEAGLSAVALSDHDTLEHLTEAGRAARARDLHLVPACELSCDTGGRVPGSLHLLVYFVEDGRGPLASELTRLQRARDERNAEIVPLLRTHGIDITLGEVLAQADGGVVGRPHIARVLVNKGVVPTIQDAFDVWLAKGRPGYRERARLDVLRAIEIAHASGGVSSVAHPLTLGLDRDSLDGYLAELAAAGLDALECEYGSYDAAERAELGALARRHGFAVSGGSDYHGENKPGVRLGVGRGDLAVPDAVLEELEARRPS